MTPRLLIACALLTTLSACSSSRWYDYRFSPAPLEAQVTTVADPEAQVRALVTVRGISRGKDGERDAVEIRMRLENLGRRSVSLVEPSLALVTADLDTFERPEITGEGQATIAPGASRTVDLAFPLPKGKEPRDLNLRGLNLSWALSFEGRDVTTSATFERDLPVRVYDPEPRVHIGVGVGTHF
jgi:hypothetical protein